MQVYTWNPGPAGVTGVDVSKWAEDGSRSRVEEGAPTTIDVPQITMAKPSWAWVGAKGQKPTGGVIEQWFTEMDTVVDDMFEAVTPVESGSGTGGGEDATMLGRSRSTTGIIGVRRRNGFVKRAAGMPPVPFVAFTLLRQPSAEDLAAKRVHAELMREAAARKTSRSKSPAESLSARDGERLSSLLGAEPPPVAATKATAWTDQSAGDGWAEDASTVVWHVAGFDQMTYNKSYALQSTKELGFSEMSFMLNPKLCECTPHSPPQLDKHGRVLTDCLRLQLRTRNE